MQPKELVAELDILRPGFPDGSAVSVVGSVHGADPATVEPKGRHKMPQDATGYSVLPYYKWKMGVSPR